MFFGFNSEEEPALAHWGSIRRYNLPLPIGFNSEVNRPLLAANCKHKTRRPAKPLGQLNKAVREDNALMVAPSRGRPNESG